MDTVESDVLIVERYNKIKPDFIDNPAFQEIVNEVEQQLFEEFKSCSTEDAATIHLELKALNKLLSRFVGIANEYKILIDTNE